MDFRSLASSERVSQKKRHIFWSKVKAQRIALLMLLPSFVGITVFTYKPMLGWIIAFTDYRVGNSIFTGKWIGLTAFKEFLIDSTDAILVLRNTLAMNIGSLIVTLFFGAMFAILLNEIKISYLKRIVQTFSLFPFFISWVIVYSIANSFIAVNSGLINRLLIDIGIIKNGINFLGDPRLSWVTIITLSLWKNLGFNAIIFLAAIAGIDTQQYEAAEVDGAGRFTKIRYITFPGLASTLVVLLILNSGWLLSSNFDLYYMFTNPRNLPTIEVFDLYVYRFGLKLGQFPYATVVSICKTVVSLIMLYGTNLLCKKIINRSIF